MQQLGSHWIAFDVILYFNSSRKSVEKMQVSSKSGKITGILRENVSTFMTISRWILLIMRNISNKSCRENQNPHFMSVPFFFLKSCPLWDKVSKVKVTSYYRPWRPLRGSRGIAVPFFVNLGTLDGGGWSTPPPGRLYPGKYLVPTIQEAGWASEPVWIGAENLAFTGIRSPDLPIRSASLYRLSHPVSSFMR